MAQTTVTSSLPKKLTHKTNGMLIENATGKFDIFHHLTMISTDNPLTEPLSYIIALTGRGNNNFVEML
jgi:hypothetical protein